jgi:uncharacterized membrane protein
MIPPPVWAVSLAYWLHMLATVAWIGSLVTLTVLVIPAARQVLDSDSYVNLLGRLRRRLDPLSWGSLLVLAATGMFQMSINPNYQGFLEINNRWALAILLKHLLFLVMVAISAYLTWGVLPRLQRAALLQAHGKESPGASRIQQQEALLLRSNLVLGLLILALTALARAS